MVFDDFRCKIKLGLAYLVSVFCFLLLFSGKSQKLQEKFRTLFSRHLPSLPQPAATGKVGDAPWPNDESLIHKYRISVMDRSLVFERTTKRQRSPSMKSNGAIQNVYHGVKFYPRINLRYSSLTWDAYPRSFCKQFGKTLVHHEGDGPRPSICVINQCMTGNPFATFLKRISLAAAQISASYSTKQNN